jgi:hypothetical protein
VLNNLRVCWVTRIPPVPSHNWHTRSKPRGFGTVFGLMHCCVTRRHLSLTSNQFVTLGSCLCEFDSRRGGRCYKVGCIDPVLPGSPTSPAGPPWLQYAFVHWSLFYLCILSLHQVSASRYNTRIWWIRWLTSQKTR